MNTEKLFTIVEEASIDDIVPMAKDTPVEKRLEIYETVIKDMHMELAKALYAIGVIGNGTNLGDEDWMAARDQIRKLVNTIGDYWRGQASPRTVQ